MCDNSIKLVEFNEEQKAAMAAALMAVAEEDAIVKKESIYEFSTNPTITDIIDLISDSEDENTVSGDCEITEVPNVLQTANDINQLNNSTGSAALPSIYYTPYNTVVTPSITIPLLSTTENSTSATTSLPVITSVISSAPSPVQKRTYDQALNIDIEAPSAEQSLDQNLSKKTPVIIFDMDGELKMTDDNIDDNDSIGDVEQLIPNTRISTTDDTFLQIGDIFSTVSEFSSNIEAGNSKSQMRISRDSTDTASERSNNDLLTSQMLWDSSNSNMLDDDSNIKLDSEDEDEKDIKVFSRPDFSLEDIIDLDDSDIEGMDQETEEAIISLIESDNEDNTTAGNDNVPSTSANKPQQRLNVCIDNLIHFKCPKCGVACGSLKKWRAHIEGEHDFRTIDKCEMDTIIDRGGTLCYQCNICKKRFKNSTSFLPLMRHHFTHLPYNTYFKCRLCNDYFNAAVKTRYHLRRSHPKICKYYIKQHTKEAGHITLQCPRCGEKQKNNLELKEHMDEMHDYEKKMEDKIKLISENVYECSICDKRFRKVWRLKHLLTHEKHKLYKCKTCKKYSSSTITAVLEHVRTEHLNFAKTKKLCMYCDAACGTPYEYRKHMQDKHGIKLLHCPVCEQKFMNSSRLLAHMSLKNHLSLK